MNRTLTLKDRKLAEKRRREAVLDEIAPILAAYALRHGGRYLLIGSAARGEMRFDSDVDIMADFSDANVDDAMRFAEEAFERLSVPVDVLDMSTRSDAFLHRALAEAKVLS